MFASPVWIHKQQFRFT